MSSFIKLCVITSKRIEKIKSFMEEYPYFYEIIEDEQNNVSDDKIYFIKMGVGFDLDLNFLIKMKEFIKSDTNIIGNPEELP